MAKAQAHVTLHLDQGAIIQVVGGAAHDSARRAANVWMGRARANLASSGRMDTGELYSSIHVTDITGDPMRPEFIVSADAPHAMFQEQGTAGARARPGGFLVFKPKGSAKYVFAKKVRGISGVHFMANAVSAASLSDFL